MKKCSYCGAEYPDDASICTIDHTPFERPAEPKEPESKKPEYRFPPISAQDGEKDFVTLLSCATLPEASVIVGRLEAAGIEVFVPDESVTTVTGGCWATFGSVRVQIASKDYDAARELLSDIYDEGERL